MNSEGSAMTGRLRWAFKFSSWIPTRDQWMLAGSLVQPEEKLRIGKFVFKKDAKSAMVGIRTTYLQYEIHVQFLTIY